MISSRSQVQIGQRPNRSRSFRCLYSNNDEHTTSKDINTIFHSPFKEGKRNKQYVNPTFTSSTLFYPQDYPNPDKAAQPSIVYNKNHKARKQLYEKRMEKIDDLVGKAHKSVAKIPNKTRKFNEQSKENCNRSRSKIQTGKNDQLLRELEHLINFRDFNDSKEKSRMKLRQIQNIGESTTPIYIQKNRKEIDQNIKEENKKNLKEWMNLTTQINKMKQSGKKERKNHEAELLNNFVAMNQQRNKQKQEEGRRTAGMLAKILKEQIKQCQAKQTKERKNRFNFE